MPDETISATIPLPDGWATMSESERAEWIAAVRRTLARSFIARTLARWEDEILNGTGNCGTPTGLINQP